MTTEVMGNDSFIEHFESYADYHGGVDALRGQILMSMIQGKLVAHNAKDEPAAKLLERSRAERKKAGRNDELPAIDHSQVPFTLPENWTWSRWGDFILDLQQGGEARQGDFLVTQKAPGEGVGVSAIVSGQAQAPKAAPNTEFMRLKMSDAVDPRFFNLTNNSPAGRGYYASMAIAAGPNVKMIETTAVTHMPFPIPPRAEQERIVAKVEKLMGLCDLLETRQHKRNEARTKFLQTIVRELFEVR